MSKCFRNLPERVLLCFLSFQKPSPNSDAQPVFGHREASTHASHCVPQGTGAMRPTNSPAGTFLKPTGCRREAIEKRVCGVSAFAGRPHVERRVQPAAAEPVTLTSPRETEAARRSVSDWLTDSGAGFCPGCLSRRQMPFPHLHFDPGCRTRDAFSAGGGRLLPILNLYFDKNYLNATRSPGRRRSGKCWRNWNEVWASGPRSARMSVS